MERVAERLVHRAQEAVTVLHDLQNPRKEDESPLLDLRFENFEDQILTLELVGVFDAEGIGDLEEVFEFFRSQRFDREPFDGDVGTVF